MSTTITERAAHAVLLPEVEEMIKKLAEYGLGVCLPHMHDPITNEMIPLPPNMVALEEGLKVSFVDRDTIEAPKEFAVAWFWYDGVKAVQGCGWCHRDKRNHC